MIGVPHPEVGQEPAAYVSADRRARAVPRAGRGTAHLLGWALAHYDLHGAVFAYNHAE